MWQVPKHVRMDMSAKLEDEARLRQFRKEERKNKLAAMSSLPRRMKEHEKVQGSGVRFQGAEAWCRVQGSGFRRSGRRSARTSSRPCRRSRAA